MTHHVDINNVQSIEVEPIAPDLLSALDGKRHSRRIIVRTKFGSTTITLRAERASDLEVSGDGAPGPRDGHAGGTHAKPKR